MDGHRTSTFGQKHILKVRKHPGVESRLSRKKWCEERVHTPGVDMVSWREWRPNVRAATKYEQLARIKMFCENRWNPEKRCWMELSIVVKSRSMLHSKIVQYGSTCSLPCNTVLLVSLELHKGHVQGLVQQYPWESPLPLERVRYYFSNREQKLCVCWKSNTGAVNDDATT